MANESRDLLLHVGLVDLHRRKTEAEMIGHSGAIYEALIDVYRLELAEIEAASRAKLGAIEAQRAGLGRSCGLLSNSEK